MVRTDIFPDRDSICVPLGARNFLTARGLSFLSRFVPLINIGITGLFRNIRAKLCPVVIPIYNRNIVGCDRRYFCRVGGLDIKQVCSIYGTFRIRYTDFGMSGFIKKLPGAACLGHIISVYFQQIIPIAVILVGIISGGCSLILRSVYRNGICYIRMIK